MHLLLLLLFSTVLFHEVACDEVSTCLCVKPADYEETYNPCSTGECNTLMYYARDNFTDDTILKFLPGDHLLNVSIPVKSVVNFTLAASNKSLDFMPTVQCSGSGAGFWFDYVQNLEITDLQFKSCGSSKYQEHTSNKALHMTYVTNMKLSCIFIYNSFGYGIEIYNLRGDSVIQSTVINGSRNTTGTSGGNIQIIYNENKTKQRHKLVITSSHFSNGVINTSMKSYASGLRLILSTTNRINLTLRNVTLTGNVGCHGGNVAITYIHLTWVTTWTSVVTIDNCTLSNGSALVGGGLYLSVVARQKKIIKKHPVFNVVNINDTIIEYNKASSVGGGAYILTYEEVELSARARINIKNSIFLNNTIGQSKNSRGGVALCIFNFLVPVYIPHQIPQYSISITSCHFVNNSVNVLLEDATLGSSTISVEGISTIKLKDNMIVRNYCTGIIAIRSGLVLEGTNTIFNNTGNNGGGLTLCDNSIIYLNDTVTVLNISHNRALRYGGGIYAEFGHTQVVPPCFFQFDNHQNKTIHVYLENNIAKSGSDLYGGSIEQCFFFGYDEPKNSTDVFLHLFHFTNKSSSITSYPQRVCFCSVDKGSLSQNCNERMRHYPMYPGGLLTVPLVPVGQMNGPVPGIVIATNVTKNIASQSVQNNSCTNISYSLLSSAVKNSISKGDNVVNISLAVQKNDFSDRIGSQNVITLLVHLKKCPLGFQLKDNCTKCVCTCLKVFPTSWKIECDIETTTIIKKHDSQSWFGFITTNDTNQVVFAENCPFDYCNQTVTHRINVTQPSTANEQCAFHRAGLLCGGCGHNLSLVFGSSRCSDCSNTSSWSCIFLVMAFLLAGVCLVLFIGVIDMTVTEGTLNAIIFYMNVTCVNRATIFGYSESPIVNFLMVFVTWMNLDLGINVCFYNGMSAFAKATFQFMFPLYLWFIAAVVIILCRISSLPSKLIGRNGVKVLATIILLSYAKLIRAAIDVIYHSTLTYSNSSGTYLHYSRVWRLDGNIAYWSKKHIILLVFANIVIAVTLPYTLALLFIQCLRKKSNVRVLWWVNKLKPFFDAYTGPYKDKYHFWTGFLLIVRILLFTGIAINTTKGPILNLTLISSTTSLLFVLIQPGLYKHWALNIIEAFTYANLTLLVAITAYDVTLTYSKYVPVILCIGSMFLLFCGVVVYHVLKKLSDTERGRLMKLWLLDMRCPWMRRKPIRSLILPYIDPDSVGDLSSSDNDNELDPILRNAPPVARYDEYREPLIETECNQGMFV